MRAELIGAAITIGILACGYLALLFADNAHDSAETEEQVIAPHSSEIKE